MHRKRHKHKNISLSSINHLEISNLSDICIFHKNTKDELQPKMTKRVLGLFSSWPRRSGVTSCWSHRLLLMTIVLGLCLKTSMAQQDTTIRLRQGTIEGIMEESSGRNIHAFLGIPYAKPPVNELRFKPPQRHNGWTSTLQAKDFGNACPQPFLTGVRISEDCLTLNVWIPELPRGFQQYPVVVMLEGELFVTSSPSRFPGKDLAASDVIVVSVNYRTNAFGFLSWKDDVLPGNLGLRDQSLALQWVSENIDMFGGDLSRVTLLGHSAGAASAAYHLVHPGIQGPFQQMIILSGSNLSPWALSRRPKDAARRLSVHLGCGSIHSSTYLLECLKMKDGNQIVKAVERLIEDGDPYYLFGPVVDDFLPHADRMVPLEPLRAIRENANRRIPVLTGLSEKDGSIFLYIKREIVHMIYDDLVRYGHQILVPLVTSLANLGDDAKAVNRMVEYAYLDKAPVGDKDQLVREIVMMFTDGMFKAPLMKFTDEIARRGLPTFLLINEFLSKDIYESHTNITGALHGTEMIYLFAPTAYRNTFNMQLTFGEERISDTLKRIVSTYASTGTPYMGQYSPRWDRYTPEDPKYAYLESSQIRQNYQHHLVAFWNRLLPNITNIVADYASSTSSEGLATPSYTTTGTSYPSFTDTHIITGDPPGPEPVKYESAVWVLVAIILLMVGVIITYIICAKRRKRLNSGTLHDQ